MLTSIIRAPAAMVKHASVYGLLLILTGVHGVLYALNEDVLAIFTDGSVAGLLVTNDIILHARAFGLLLASLIIMIYSLATVSRAMTKTPAGNNSLFFSSLAFSVVLLAAGAGWYVLTSAVNAVAALGGIVGLLSLLIMAVVGLITALCVVKFAFTPAYVGRGFLPKDALAQSWNATRGKLLSTIIILLAITIIAGLVQGMVEIVFGFLTDETILTVIYFISGALGIFYSGTVLALAAPETNTLAPRRMHGKK